jgi:hypothetical protein
MLIYLIILKKNISIIYNRIMNFKLNAKSNKDLVLFRTFIIHALFDCHENKIDFVDGNINNFNENNIIFI